MNRMLVFWIAMLLLVGGGLFIWKGWKMSQAERVGAESEVDPTPPEALNPAGKDAPILERYTLLDSNGKAFKSEDLLGKVHVASFFFSNCPHDCLRMNKQIKQYQDEFGPEGVLFVSITCDPESDSPARLRQYADKLEAEKEQWKFLTGDLLYIRRVGAEIYQVPVDKQSHTEKLVVIDRNGKIQGRYSWKDVNGIAEMKKALRRLLAEEEAATTNTPLEKVEPRQPESAETVTPNTP